MSQRGILLQAILLATTACVPIEAGSINYTCDSSIEALHTNGSVTSSSGGSNGICGYLNSTIAGLYGSAFTNATASIYIKMGHLTNQVGHSDTIVNFFNTGGYNTLRDALFADATSANDATAITHLPSSEPSEFNGRGVLLSNANMRALNLGTPALGVNGANTATCSSPGTPDCYDGIITISDSLPSNGHFTFRGLSSSGGPTDFFSIVEHETDEVLGTRSCVTGCGFQLVPNGPTVNFISPTDLFRYHSDGTRSFGESGNQTCEISDSQNACFSLDGINMLMKWNNVASLGDLGDWADVCGHVQDYAACTFTQLANRDIAPDAEIKLLDVIGYTPVAAIPEPSSGVLVVVGLALVALRFLRGYRTRVHASILSGRRTT
jgi:hypothetical protein